MEPADAVALAKQLTINGRVTWTTHGRGRGGERSASALDVRSAILTATTAVYRAADDSWRLEGGVDLDDDSLDVVLAFKDDGTAKVVTVR
jgi:hypothetical protein